MKRSVLAAVMVLPLSAAAASIDNPAIDIDGHLRLSAQAAVHRTERRIGEKEFLRMSREPGTIVLDARSRDKFDELHIAGAISRSREPPRGARSRAAEPRSPRRRYSACRCARATSREPLGPLPGGARGPSAR